MCIRDSFNDVFDVIVVFENSTFVDMATNEENFRNDEWQLIFSSLRVDRFKLLIG